MEFIANNLSTLALGLALPLSTMAAVAIGCGDNRRPVNRKRHSKPSKKLAMHPSGRHHSSKKHSSRSSSSKHGAKHGSSQLAHNKDQMKQQMKESAKQSSAKVKEGAKESSAKLKDGASKASHKVKEGASKVKEGAGEASKKVKEGANVMSKKVKEGANVASKKVKEGANKASDKLKSAKGSAKQTIDSKLHEGVKSGSRHSNSKHSGKTSNASSTSQISKATLEKLDIVLEPQQLVYDSTGGLKQITLRSNNAKRQAIKLKCSDNGLYRVNPVYAFIEPGKQTSFNVYRNSNATSDAKVDKLVVVLADVSDKETNPMNAFQGKDKSHPMLVMPLLSGSNGIASRCPCVK